MILNNRLVLAAATSTMALLVLDSSIIGVMLPSMSNDFELTTTGTAWVVSSYLLALAVLLPIGGRISDRYGAVTGFLLGTAGFSAASAGIALASGEVSLIVWRSVAGAAAALLLPATMSLIFATFADAVRARALAIYAGFGQAFALVGPAVGGICAQYLSWEWGFLINVPVGAVAIVLMLLARPDNPRNPIVDSDAAGIALMVTGMTGVMFALLQGPTMFGPATVVIAAIGLALLVVFVLRARRRPTGLLDLALFRKASYTGGTIILACLGFGMTVATIYGAVVLQEALQLSPAAGGIALLPMIVPLLLATRYAGAHYQRIGPKVLGVWGGLAMTAGLLMIAAGIGFSSLWLVCLGMMPAGAGMGALMTPMTNAALTGIDAAKRGQASGIVTMSKQFGSVLGVGVFAALIAAVSGTGAQDNTGPGVVIGFVVAAAVLAVATLTAAVTLSGPQRAAEKAAAQTVRT